jgi:pyruvate,orthophosphate dikinase
MAKQIQRQTTVCFSEEIPNGFSPMESFVQSFEDFPRLLGEHPKDAVTQLVGDKAFRLSEVHSLGITIPSGFVITSVAFKKYAQLAQPTIADEIWNSIKEGLAALEKKSGLQFGGANTPLLISCRCDAPDPMSGMLDTVVNVGLNDLTVRGLSRASGNRAFVWDSYRRLVQGYGTVVLKIPPEAFESLLDEFMTSRKRTSSADFTDLDWIEVTKLYKSVIMRKTGNPFPQDAWDQFKRVTTALFDSFNSDKLKAYRKFSQIPDDKGISIIVSQMAFGNNDKQRSLAAVVTSRNPVDGSPGLSGDFARNALVSDITGCFTPVTGILGLTGPELNSMQTSVQKIENHYKQPQIVDFISERGRVSVLQTRTLSFAVTAKFQAIWDMAAANIISSNDALAAIKSVDLQHLMMPVLAKRDTAPFCQGVSAGNRTVSGKICLSVDRLRSAPPGDPLILVKTELFPRDFGAFIKSAAIVTAKGGNNSHAAYLTRSLMTTAAIGCEGLAVDLASKTITCNGTTLKEGALITVCGNGIVVAGAQPLAPALNIESVAARRLLDSADSARKGKLSICTIVSSAAQVGATIALGADAVGLFPIESLFEEKSSILIRLLLGQKKDLGMKKIQELLDKTMVDVFAAAKDVPISIRLFTPAFYSFFQTPAELTREIGLLKAKKEMSEEEDSKEEKELEKKSDMLENVKGMQEKNQIFGLRGVRLNIVNNDFMTIQIRAIMSGIKAAVDAGGSPKARILVPEVSTAGEIARCAAIYYEIAADLNVTAEIGAELAFPRACLAVNTFLDRAKFLLIKPAELTAATFGADQGPAERTFLKSYNEWGWIKSSPFSTIDVEGVGQLIRIAVEKARAHDPNMEVGVAGPMCADPDSIAFLYRTGVSSIICDFAAVPIARLCSAQAVITSS